LGKLVSQVDFTLDNANEGAAKNFGKDIAQAMSDGFNTSTYFQDAVKSTIDRAQKIAQDRTLQPVQITASKLGGEPKAKEEDPSKKLIKQLHDLKGRYDSVAAAQIEFSDGVKILDEGLKFHLITETEYYDILNKMGMALNDQLRPMEALDRQYQMQLNWLKLTTDEMQVQQDLYNMKMDLQQHGISLTDTEIEQWKVRLTQMQTETRLASERNKLLDDTVGKRRSELERLDQIKKLSQDPTSGFTENDKITELNSGGMFAGLFEGTSDLVKAQVDQFKWMYEQIDKLKKDGVISTEAAAMAESQIWAQEQKARFSMADKFLGNLAALQNSKNKEMARIGKAAAIAQATIATYTSAVEAYKSLAGIPYVGPALGAAAAAAAIAAGLANVQAIKQQNAGFMAGGYTGGISDRDVMGPVHGREFVMNAPATRRLGPDNLDALQKGTAQIVPKSDNVSGSNRPLKVSIENYGTSKQFEVQTLSPDEVRIIARDEAKQQVDLHAPRAVARELSNPNSTVSRSMAQNTSAQRRR
jgi:hypothetical protein